jgi:aspartate carbamoyltransferase catalytic subunit
MNRHLLSIDDLDRDGAISILDTAFELSKISDGAMKKLPTLRGRTVVNLFFEDSTRTRISFESAAKRLSADVINFSAKGSSVSKGESLKDTAQTLQAMGADAVIIRHGASGAATRLADSGWISASVINAGDGTHEHPTQALLDAYTIRSKFPELRKDFSGLKVAIVGDILHSRVARSNVLLLKKLGAEVTLVSLPTLLPVGVDSWGTKISYSFDTVLKSVDVVMMLRIQSERMNEAFFPTAREYSRGFGLDQDRLESLKPNAIVMHPGPMNRGLEISAASADSHKSVVLDQVSNGVLVRMAVLYQLLGGAPLNPVSNSKEVVN